MAFDCTVFPWLYFWKLTNSVSVAGWQHLLKQRWKAFSATKNMTTWPVYDQNWTSTHGIYYILVRRFMWVIWYTFHSCALFGMHLIFMRPLAHVFIIVHYLTHIAFCARCSHIFVHPCRSFAAFWCGFDKLFVPDIQVFIVLQLLYETQFPFLCNNSSARVSVLAQRFLIVV